MVACFEALCGVLSLNGLSKRVPTLQFSRTEIDLVEKECDWSIAKHWAQWWARSDHLKMLSEVFTSMDAAVWSKCPTTTNAVERKNMDYKSDNPGSLRLAMIKVYKLDKVACLKHIAAELNVSLSYRSHSEEARLADAQRKRKQRQKTLSVIKLQFEPPDKLSNFAPSASSSSVNETTVANSTLIRSSRKRKVAPNNIDSSEKRRAVEVGNATLNLVPSHDPSAIGRKVKTLFDVESGMRVLIVGNLMQYASYY